MTPSYNRKSVVDTVVTLLDNPVSERYLSGSGVPKERQPHLFNSLGNQVYDDWASIKQQDFDWGRANEILTHIMENPEQWAGVAKRFTHNRARAEFVTLNTAGPTSHMRTDVPYSEPQVRNGSGSPTAPRPPVRSWSSTSIARRMRGLGRDKGRQEIVSADISSYLHWLERTESFKKMLKGYGFEEEDRNSFTIQLEADWQKQAYLNRASRDLISDFCNGRVEAGLEVEGSSTGTYAVTLEDDMNGSGRKRSVVSEVIVPRTEI